MLTTIFSLDDTHGRNVKIRDAREDDLATIVEIYNASIPSRLATADTEPVSIEARGPWFNHHEPTRHPLWVLEREQAIAGWLSFEPFYGRPAYVATAEVSVYVTPRFHRQGLGTAILRRAVEAAPSLSFCTLLGFIFAHNIPSITLFKRLAFAEWGRLPQVAELDGVKRDLLILGRQVP
jgi:L-amino acid N-acyltransferase YncA